MFVRMLAVHCYQHDSYDVTMNGYQARKINDIRKYFAHFSALITMEHLLDETETNI